MVPPSPSERAVIPFAPSAPTITSARTRSAVEPYGDAVAVRLDRRDLHAVAEVGAGRGRLLREVVVEPAPLRHQHERPAPAALEPAPVAEPELERVDDVLDDRRRVDRQLADARAA